MKEEKDVWKWFMDRVRAEKKKESEVAKVAKRMQDILRREKMNEPFITHFTRQALTSIAFEEQYRDRARFKPGNCKRGGEYLEKLSAAIYDDYIVEGVRLGDCTRGTLLSHASHLRKCADGMIQNATFEERVAARLPDDEATVRDTISTAELIQLKHQASGNTAAEAKNTVAAKPKRRANGKGSSELEYGIAVAGA